MTGRRRNIRHLWAFILLGQIVAISFAMNLFFLAVLLTPVPLPARRRDQSEQARPRQSSSSTTSATAVEVSFDIQTATNRLLSTLKTLLPPLITRPHSPEWNPHPAAIITPLTALYACVFLLPYSVSTPQFWSFLLIPHLVLFRPLYLNRLAPIAYGSTKNPHRTYLVVYRCLSYASLLFHLKQTFVAVLDNDPGEYQHRHSHFLASLRLPHEDVRGPVHRTTSSFARVLGSLSDHPAVARVGWDVLMCAVSLATWAVIRGLNISRIACAAGLTPSTGNQHSKTSNSTHTHSTSVTSATSATANASPGLKVRRRRKPSAKVQGEDEGAEKDGDFSPSEPVAPNVVGEEEADENLEAGAISWALCALGGLGVLASGVFGAEFDT